VPAFEAVLEDAGGDLEVFYDGVGALAKLTPQERRRRLAEITPAAPRESEPAAGADT
jgi:hypothetical protein